MRPKDNLLLVILVLALLGWLAYRSGGSGAFGGEPTAAEAQAARITEARWAVEAAEAKVKAAQEELAAARHKLALLLGPLGVLEELQKNAGITMPTPGPLISLLYEGKKLMPADIMARRYQDFLVLKLTWTNNTAKPVRAFKGNIIFKDLLDEVILVGAWTCEKPIEPGQSVTENDRGMEINAFSNSQQRLSTIKSKDLKVEFKLTKILYADGTKEDF